MPKWRSQAALEVAIQQANEAIEHRTYGGHNLEHEAAAIRHAMSLQAVDDPDRGRYAVYLARALAQCWQWTGDEGLWAEAYEEVSRLGEGLEPTSPASASYILAQGSMLAHRAQITKSPEDVWNAVGLLEQARSRIDDLRLLRLARPELTLDERIYPIASLLLASLRVVQDPSLDFDVVENETAIYDIHCYLAAASVQPKDTLSANLLMSWALYQRYRAFGDIGDLKRARIVAQETLPTKGGDGRLRADLNGLLACISRDLGEESRSESDLDDAIAYVDAVESSSSDSVILTHIKARAYFSKFKLAGRQSDLAASINSFDASLKLLPPDDPRRDLFLARLAAAWLESGRLLKLTEHARLAVELSKEGVAQLHDSAGPETVALLSATLAEALLLVDALTVKGAASHLGNAIGVLEAGLRMIFDGLRFVTIRERLTTLEYAAPIRRLLVGCLIERSRTNPDTRAEDLRMAFVVGEACKSFYLTQECLRRTIEPPTEMRDELDWEQVLLAQASACDARELLEYDESEKHRILEMSEGRKIRSRLEAKWTEMERHGSFAADYVGRQRNPVVALDSALKARDPSTAMLSIQDATLVDTDGNTMHEMYGLLLHGDESAPLVIFRTPVGLFDDAQREVEALVMEANFRFSGPSLDILIDYLREAPLGGHSMISVTPHGPSFGLPWGWLVNAAAWTPLSGEPVLGVIVEPCQALVLMRGTNPRMKFELLGIPAGAPNEPSASSFLVPPPTESNGAFVIGDPTGDLASAGDEARDVGVTLNVKPLVGASATKEAVIAALSSKAVVHIAAHAKVDPADPLQSAVRLADGELTVSSIIGNASACKLMVLSACESGSGGKLRGGELLNFAAALLATGVEAVISSSWEVDDAATAFFMDEFYSALLSGLKPCDALVSAMLAVRAETGWESPYYWAAFSVAQRGDPEVRLSPAVLDAV